MVELVSLRKTNEVAAYVRASLDRKGDRWTVETQLKKIRALAEAKDGSPHLSGACADFMLLVSALG
ncbi:hypothetical protein [Brevibacterium linens]|uniref:hypothetical protein n=1 Tax=Brevibacterium linens TaxID=1703 RepID=UPI003F89B38E